MIYNFVMEPLHTEFFQMMHFPPVRQNNYVLFQDSSCPGNGSCTVFERENCYTFLAGDYTVPGDFALQFHVEKPVIRVGIFYQGSADTVIQDTPSVSLPGSYLVKENQLRGMQSWHKNDHFCGIELLIKEQYIRYLAENIDPEIIDILSLPDNHTFRYLPESVYQILEEIRRSVQGGNNSSLLLESRVLAALCALKDTVSASDSTFRESDRITSARVGNRTIFLYSEDMEILQNVHHLIRTSLSYPPTIEDLSRLSGMHIQKLKAAFKACFHMTIGEYSVQVRMDEAERLLLSTRLSIREIAARTGYQQPASFARMFRETHGLSPSEFRRNQIIQKKQA